MFNICIILQILIGVQLVKTYGYSLVEIESSWDRNMSTIEAGDEITFICTVKVGDIIQNSASVFLFCPLLNSYCAQDCNFVNFESDKALECSQIYTKDASPGPDQIEWHIQEIRYRIKKARLKSGGDWYCSFSNKKTKKLSLRVKDRPTLEYLKSNRLLPLDEGEDVELICHANESPQSQQYHFFWFKNHVQIKNHEKMALDQLTSKLIIRNLTYRDIGEYGCLVKKISLLESHSLEVPRLLPEDLLQDPSFMAMDLDVYHVPRNPVLEIKPNRRHLIGELVNLKCSYEGGNPDPIVKYYRRPKGRLAKVQVNEDELELLPNNGQFQLREEDIDAEYYCTLMNRCLKAPIISEGISLDIAFPPKDLSISMYPMGEISQDRERAFTCQSGSGSNPRANIEWRFYIKSSNQIDNEKKTTRKIFKEKNGERIVLEQMDFKNYEHVIQQGVNHSAINTITNHNVISKIKSKWSRQTNGLFVQCVLLWSSERILATSSKSSEVTLESEILKNEILFPPDYVRITQTGYRDTQERINVLENSNDQYLECSAGFSNPASKIEWTFSEKSNPFERVNGQIYEKIDVINDRVNGYQVKSTIQLPRFSRNSETIHYRCSVLHKEIDSPMNATVSLNIIYPPNLQLEVSPNDWPERSSTRHTIIKCLANGGKPEIPHNIMEYPLWADKVVDPSWKFSWSFAPFFPDSPLMSIHHTSNGSLTTQNIIDLVESHKEPWLKLDGSGRQLAGNYSCQLAGLAGVVRKTEPVLFSVSPELISLDENRIRINAIEGHALFLDLYIRSYPGLAEVDSKMIRWFRITTENTLIPFEEKITSRSPIVERSPDNPIIKEKGNSEKFIWTSIISREITYQKLKRDGKYPISILRFQISSLKMTDFGSYLCEINHSGKITEFHIKISNNLQIEPNNLDLSKIQFDYKAMNLLINLGGNYVTDGQYSLRTCLVSREHLISNHINGWTVKLHKRFPNIYMNTFESLYELTGVETQQCIDIKLKADANLTTFQNYSLAKLMLLVEEQEERILSLAYQLRYFDGNGQLTFESYWYYDSKVVIGESKILETINYGFKSSRNASLLTSVLFWVGILVGVTLVIVTIGIALYLHNFFAKRKPCGSSYPLNTMPNIIQNNNNFPLNHSALGSPYMGTSPMQRHQFLISTPTAYHMSPKQHLIIANRYNNSIVHGATPNTPNSQVDSRRRIMQNSTFFGKNPNNNNSNSTDISDDESEVLGNQLNKLCNNLNFAQDPLETKNLCPYQTDKSDSFDSNSFKEKISPHEFTPISPAIHRKSSNVAFQKFTTINSPYGTPMSFRRKLNNSLDPATINHDFLIFDKKIEERMAAEISRQRRGLSRENIPKGDNFREVQGSLRI